MEKEVNKLSLKIWYKNFRFEEKTLEFKQFSDELSNFFWSVIKVNHWGEHENDLEAVAWFFKLGWCQL